ncbi:hypothetical protein HYH03_014061 [Edaphochlamys debaryana]|uniref:HNH nuclease domain-containing protein n=1 Tax=Edaphochlamys debaryana TaxID=47281 RepID=A0A836BSC5_9CHLO|nr:hypothetical protein HYH03_014061 [Edaphochlamys debaryana]|eukprot:KAG2487346.1 hypothetical protein HYH03_014061 [Edaphochlamys debaryana]
MHQLALRAPRAVRPASGSTPLPPAGTPPISGTNASSWSQRCCRNSPRAVAVSSSNLWSGSLPAGCCSQHAPCSAHAVRHGTAGAGALGSGPAVQLIRVPKAGEAVAAVATAGALTVGRLVVAACMPPGANEPASAALGAPFSGKRANRRNRRASKSSDGGASGPSASPVTSPVGAPSAGSAGGGGAASGGGSVAAAAAVATATTTATATVVVADSGMESGVESDFEGVARAGNHIVPFARRSPRALVLDCAYRPINVLTWYRAFHFEYFGKGEVLEYYPPPAVCTTGSGEHPLPAVLRVPKYTADMQDLCSRVACTRRNIMVRDGFCCQYCGSRRELTIDHVHPVSKGGKETWENLVTACMRCNQKKSDRSLRDLGWKLKRTPKEPTPYEIGIVAGISTADILRPPPEWEAYIAPYKERLENHRRAAVEAGLWNLMEQE